MCVWRQRSVRQLPPGEEVVVRSYEVTKDQFCLNLVIKNLPFTSNSLLGYLNCLMRQRNMKSWQGRKHGFQ